MSTRVGYDFGHVNLYDRDSIRECLDRAAEDVRELLDYIRGEDYFSEKNRGTIEAMIAYQDSFQDGLEGYGKEYDEFEGDAPVTNNSSYLNAMNDSMLIQKIARQHIRRRAI